MKPAGSIILFTTLAGAAQGIAVVVAVATLLDRAPRSATPLMLWAATGMLIAALVSSFFHLGHPLRAWRAVLMWRTSWMSREVIALPFFILLIATWAVDSAVKFSASENAFAVLAILGALGLWYCTAMIYACIRFIQEWAHPLTIINYVTLGLASGLVASGSLAALSGDAAFASDLAPWAIAGTGIAWITRGMALVRNARLRPRSSVQSATGINASHVVQKSMGMTGGSFNTREFFHGAPASVFSFAKPCFQILAYAVPLALLFWAAGSGATLPWLFACAVQAVGLLVERWFFFAQARHPQNIYYQAVS